MRLHKWRNKMNRDNIDTCELQKEIAFLLEKIESLLVENINLEYQLKQARSELIKQKCC